jgi:hypothetical protein
MILVGLVCLIGLSPAYAGDCSTTFDQSCLSGEYDAEQAEADHKRSVERIEQNLAAREEEERRLKEERKKAEEEGRQKEQIALEQAQLYEQQKQNRKLEEINRKLGPTDPSYQPLFLP